jgi:hypothetical protein
MTRYGRTGWRPSTRFRDELARFMHTQAELVCPQPSVSAALTQILGAPCP